MKLVCLDNHILIWGIRESATSGQERMVHRAKAFIDDCFSNGTQLVIPSVVMGEMLTDIPAREHQLVINLMVKGFFLAPYDIKAAAVFAKVWKENKDSGLTQSIRNELMATRQELKADAMIVATAISLNCEAIYSYDEKLARFAGNRIPVRKMPELEIQAEMEFSGST